MKKSNLHFNLPKQCTQSLEFIEKTNYDGKGILIAILDSGVDPGAECMQTLPDGGLKVIDYHDATGCGIVDTSLVVKKDEKEFIVSPFSKKEFDVSKINCPSGEFQIGFKSLYDVYPEKLTRRMKEERKEKFEILSNTIKQEEKDENIKKIYDSLSTSFEDLGPFVDCILWKESTGKIRACLPLFDDPRTDLSTIENLTTYRDEPKYLTFSNDCRMNYTINIFDDGKRLSIVNPLSGHGTHVASICAGYYPNTPELNGVAPGANIISIKIADSRLDSDGMETGTSVVKGLYLAKQLGADLINFSFGEPAHNCSEGIVRKILKKMWKEDNIIMCASAGNSGPGFGTTGAPGSTYPETFGIGAFVNREMMKTQYYLSPVSDDLKKEEEEEEEEEGESNNSSYHELDNETLQIWSSCGPASNGWYGPDFIAPGSSIAGIPNFMLCRNSLKNGTSMSSPHACGNLGLLLSALKGEGIEWSPHYIRMMVQSTARYIPGCHPYRQGAGLIQILDCLEQCKKYPLKEKVFYNFGVNEFTDSNGLYIRNFPGGFLKLQVYVKPIFHKSNTQKEKLEFEKHFKLVIRNKGARNNWLRIPDYFSLPNETRSFQVGIDGSKFDKEGMYSTEILAYHRKDTDDDDNDEIDEIMKDNPVPAFRIPVCVIVPKVIKDTTFSFQHRFGDHDNHRPVETNEIGIGLHHEYLSSRRMTRFFEIPYGATFATIKVRPSQPMKPSELIMFKYVSMLVLNNTRFSHTKGDSYFRLWKDQSEAVFNIIGLSACETLEITILQHWKYTNNIELDISVEWKGIQLLGPPQINVQPPYHPITMHSPITKTKQKVTMSGCFNRLKTFVQVSKREITVSPKWDLDCVRDPYTMKALHYLTLEYFFKQPPTSSNTVLSLGRVHDHLYEGEFLSVLSFVFNNSTKALLNVLDFKAGTKKGIKLPSDAWIKVVTRISHHDISMLKTFNPELMIYFSFSPSVKLEFWRYRHDALIGKGSKMDKFFLYSNRDQKVFCSFNKSKLPISKYKVKGGDQFWGTFSVDNITKNRIMYSVPSKSRNPPSSQLSKKKAVVTTAVVSSKKKNLQKSSQTKLQERIVSSTIGYLKTMSKSIKEEEEKEEELEKKELLRKELQRICDDLKLKCVDDKNILWDVFRVEVRLQESNEKKLEKLEEGISRVDISKLLLSLFDGMGVVKPAQKREQEELEWSLFKKVKVLLALFLDKKEKEEKEKKNKKEEEKKEEVEGEDDNDDDDKTKQKELKKEEEEEDDDETKQKEPEEKEKEKEKIEEEEEEDKKEKPKKKKEDDDVIIKELEKTFTEWKKWTHQNQTKKNMKNIILESRIEWKVRNKRDIALGLIKKFIFKKEDLFDMYLEMLGDLKWKYWNEHIRRTKLIKFPNDFKKIF